MNSSVNRVSNGRHFADDIFKRVFMNEMLESRFNFHWNLFLRVQLTIISNGSDNGLSPIRRQIIIQTNAGLLSIVPLGTNFIEILIKIQSFVFPKMHLNILSAKWRPFCPGGRWVYVTTTCAGSQWDEGNALEGIVCEVFIMMEHVSWWPLLGLLSGYPVM